MESGGATNGVTSVHVGADKRCPACGQTRPRCRYCGEYLEGFRTKNALYCDVTCRTRFHRERKKGKRPDTAYRVFHGSSDSLLYCGAAKAHSRQQAIRKVAESMQLPPDSRVRAHLVAVAVSALPKNL